MFCTKCGQKNEDDAIFCKRCGVKFKISDSEQGRASDVKVSGSEYAGFWRRAGAYLIDLFLISIVIQIVKAIILILWEFFIEGLHPSFLINSFESEEAMAGFFAFWIGMFLWWLYYAFMESSEARATFGKRILGLVVTDLEGNKIFFGRATARFIGKLVLILIMSFSASASLGESGGEKLMFMFFVLVASLGFITAGFTNKKQALYDIVARCLVVKKRK